MGKRYICKYLGINPAPLFNQNFFPFFQRYDGFLAYQQLFNLRTNNISNYPKRIISVFLQRGNLIIFDQTGAIIFFYTSPRKYFSVNDDPADTRWHTQRGILDISGFFPENCT
ncbi:hypothetical protein LCGC14_1731350 [marine sediment metagenome]|uniref:Uncharacterized protein n=1 Tax=marine sediment metagenome TaxID=412755 RepID=A0A0F9H9D6_9ZZZZ